MNYIFLLNMSFFYFIVCGNKKSILRCKNTHFCNIKFAKTSFFSHKVCKKLMFYHRRNKKCRFRYSVLSYYINLQPFSR